MKQPEMGVLIDVKDVPIYTQRDTHLLILAKELKKIPEGKAMVFDKAVMARFHNKPVTFSNTLYKLLKHTPTLDHLWFSRRTQPDRSIVYYVFWRKKDEKQYDEKGRKVIRRSAK